MLRRIAAWVPALLWAALIFRLSGGPAVFTSESTLLDTVVNGAGHAGEYAVLAALIYLPLSNLGSYRGWRIPLFAAAMACAYAASDELHQSFVPGRDADYVDWLVDCVASGLSVLALVRLSPRLFPCWRQPDAGGERSQPPPACRG